MWAKHSIPEKSPIALFVLFENDAYNNLKTDHG
jgi:hypothetical protein